MTGDVASGQEARMSAHSDELAERLCLTVRMQDATGLDDGCQSRKPLGGLPSTRDELIHTGCTSMLALVLHPGNGCTECLCESDQENKRLVPLEGKTRLIRTKPGAGVLNECWGCTAEGWNMMTVKRDCLRG